MKKYIAFLLLMSALCIADEAWGQNKFVDGQLESGNTGKYSNSEIGSSSSTGENIKGNNRKPLSIVIIDTDFCQHLAITAETEDASGQYQQAYDTAKLYIEHCANLSYAYSVFQFIGGYNSQRSSELHRYEEYREWLKKVLYLNADTDFYCSDVTQMLSTFRWFNDARGHDYKGALAVLDFLVKNKRCDYQFIDTVNIPATWTQTYKIWEDSVQNPDLTPFDSTLPSLEDLDLGILRGQNGVHVSPISNSSAIGGIIASENPFTNETSLRIELNDAALLKLEIFDVLGKRYYSDSKFFQQGDGMWKIGGKDLPHGTLYVRVSTLSGETKTIKLVHE